MPIYEFYCPDCHTIFNFFSRSVNTEKKPDCPQCRRLRLERQVSRFAVTGQAQEDSEGGEPPVDEAKMAQAMQMLEREAGSIKEDDPRGAANLMRKLTDMTGMEMGSNMQEALRRMEAGEDPEKIEADLGDSLEHENRLFPTNPKAGSKSRRPPRHDETLYEM